MISTPRLLLRPWRDEDLDAFAAICADPVVMEHFPATLDREAAALSATRNRYHFERYGYGMYAVELPGVSKFMGYVGLQRVSFSAPFVPEPPEFTVEIGWRLARAHWGRGYATEAARAVLDHGFTWLGRPEIVAFTVPANIRSRRVMERIGMTHDAQGDFDHPRLPDGHALQRHVLYRVAKPG